MAIHKVLMNAQLAAKRSHLVFKETLEGLNQFQLPKSLVKFKPRRKSSRGRWPEQFQFKYLESVREASSIVVRFNC